MKNKPLLPLLKILLLIYCLISTSIFSQSLGVQPTKLPGSNSVSFDEKTNKYEFYFNGTLCFEYKVLPDTTTNGGTFNTLRAFAENETSFLPSNFGGIRVKFGNSEVYPWDPGVSFILLSHKILNGDTVQVYWQMNAKGESIRYKYKFTISGRTLVIRVQIDEADKDKALSFELDRCEEAQDPAQVEVPYLPIFSVLFSNNMFTSFYNDWETSNASQLNALNGKVTMNDKINPNSIRYAQSIIYSNNANSTSRNRMLETLYLTTSQTLEEVLPNIPNPTAPYKTESADLIVWDYRRPFARLIRPPWNYLDKLRNAEITNLWIQIHDWQHYHGNSWSNLKSGYDDGLPCVLDANSTDETGSEYGGKQVLTSIIERASNYGYRVGLHENYVDYYPNASDKKRKMGWNPNDVAIGNDSKFKKAFKSDRGTQSYLLKPSKITAYASYWSKEIQKEYPGLFGCYLDVQSAGIPTPDYDNSVTNWGMYRETLKLYRSVYDTLRANHKGPILGEGGAQFLYQGYADDFEARLIVPTRYEPGYNFPLLVDFDLLKLHSKAMVHGVGWFPLWKGFKNPRPTKDEVLSYIATELAYGHGAYLCDEFDAQMDFIQHATLEYKHVFSVQKDIANAAPISILYNDNDTLKTASDYIRSHPSTYGNINSPDFMGQVRVEYDNGIIIYVNRHPSRSWDNINVGKKNGWFNYNANDKLEVGKSPVTTFKLPPNNGWVVYDPLKNP